jgi:very-short-patch-repair endonuclease
VRDGLAARTAATSFYHPFWRDTVVGMAGEKKIHTARSLRQRETELERRLWQELRGHRLAGLKFRRQHPVGPYVSDFACPEAKLNVEIDDYWHQFRRARDDYRSDRLRAFGYDVVRFETSDADADVGALVEAILFAVRGRIAFLSSR